MSTTVPITIDREIVNRLVHDLWFDLDAVRHDYEQRTVDIELGVKKGKPFGELKLAIRGADRILVEDEAKIGVYELDRIEFGDRLIVLHSSFPCRLLITIGVGASVDVTAP